MRLSTPLRRLSTPATRLIKVIKQWKDNEKKNEILIEKIKAEAALRDAKRQAELEDEQKRKEEQQKRLKLEQRKRKRAETKAALILQKRRKQPPRQAKQTGRYAN